MSNIITTTGRSIGTVTAEIVAISNQAAQMAYMSMIEIGKRLVEAKGLVEHGEWGDWLKNEVKFSQRTANNFMNIYRRSAEGNSQAFANLNYSQIVELLALPAGDAEEFAESHDVQGMSVRELKAAIAEEKQLRADAEKALEDAQGRANKAEKAKDRAGKSKANALNLVEKYKQELQAAQEKERTLRIELEEARENPQIPEQMLEQLRRDASADAEKRAAEELESKLAEAQAAAREAEAKLESAQNAAQKAEKMANRDVAAFNYLGNEILDNFNRLEGYRLKIVAQYPEMDPKTREFMRKLVDKINAKVGGADGK